MTDPPWEEAQSHHAGQCASAASLNSVGETGKPDCRATLSEDPRRTRFRSWTPQRPTT